MNGAVYAAKHLASLPKPAAPITPAVLKLDQRQFTVLVDEQQQAVIDAKGVKKVGYLCNYTPVELLSAAGTLHSRLVKGGSSKTVASGELFTQSVFCDFTKSCIGNFQEGDPLYKSFDRVYNFHTCANMKRATEVIETFVSTKLLNLPKLRDSKDARDFFREEILVFKQDLEELTGHPIADEEVRQQIVTYNKIRRLYKQISELRKRANPPLSGRDYLDLVRGFFYLPADKLLTALEQVYRHYQDLEPASKRQGPPLRLMISGSVVADGDRRILNILEEEIGARVVIEDHCSGVRPFYHPLPETGDPYRALANGYLAQSPWVPAADQQAWAALDAQGATATNAADYHAQMGTRGQFMFRGQCLACHTVDGYRSMRGFLASQQVNFCLIPEVPFAMEGPNGLYEALRKRLLALGGVGPDTADAILLYALGHAVPVADEYLRRIAEEVVARIEDQVVVAEGVILVKAHDRWTH